MGLVCLLAGAAMFLANNAFVPVMGILRVKPGDPERGRLEAGGEMEPAGRVSLVLVLTRTGLALRASDGTSMSFPVDRDARGTLRSATLGRVLAKTVAASPCPHRIGIEVDDDASYDDLIQVLDACAGAGFEAVSVRGTSAD